MNTYLQKYFKEKNNEKGAKVGLIYQDLWPVITSTFPFIETRSRVPSTTCCTRWPPPHPETELPYLVQNDASVLAAGDHHVTLHSLDGEDVPDGATLGIVKGEGPKWRHRFHLISSRNDVKVVI